MPMTATTIELTNTETLRAALPSCLTETNFTFGKKYRGKVRDTYDLGDGRLLIVATDRISAFDVVLSPGIPDKGTILTQISNFWFKKTAGLVPNHLLDISVDDVVADPAERDIRVETENVIAAKKAGVNNYIVKPFNAQTLKTKIEAVFAE